MTCATVLHQLNFSDQLIKECTGHRSLESLHKYKRTGSDQQHKVSMALLPPVAKRGKESDWDDDFEPLKKHPKLKDVEGIFPQSSISHCTFNINFTTYRYTGTSGSSFILFCFFFVLFSFCFCDFVVFLVVWVLCYFISFFHMQSLWSMQLCPYLLVESVP